MKVYVVIDEWITDYDNAIEVLGVYETLKSAKEKLKQEKEYVQSEIKYNVSEDTDDGWTGYFEGDYALYHTNIFIKEVEVQK